MSAPEGVYVVTISPRGDVIGTGADFDASGYGGFTLEESQKLRARKRAHRDTVKRLCSDLVTDCLDEYEVEQIWAAMARLGLNASERSRSINSRGSHDLPRRPRFSLTEP